MFLDDVRLPADAIVGDEDGGLVQLFAGLNPQAHHGRVVLHRAGPVRARPRVGVRQGGTVFKDAIGSPPGDRAPARAVSHIEIETPG